MRAYSPFMAILIVLVLAVGIISCGSEDHTGPVVGDTCTSGDDCPADTSCLDEICVSDNGCLIDAQLYDGGQPSPDSDCQICDPSFDQQQWADDCPDGQSCDEGQCVDNPDASRVEVTIDGDGFVNSHPAGIGCSDYCTSFFDVGDVLTVFAIPGDQDRFVGWYDEDDVRISSAPVLSLDITDNDREILAIFEPLFHHVVVHSVPDGIIEFTGDEPTLHATETTLTFEDKPGYEFSHWQDFAGKELSDAEELSILVESDLMIVAVFDIRVATEVDPGANNGVLDPTEIFVPYTETTTFDAIADIDHKIDDIYGCAGILNGSTYTTAAITEPCTVFGSFVLDETTISTYVGERGSISPTEIVVIGDESVSFDITVDDHFYVKDITGCDGELTDLTFTIDSAEQDCTIIVDIESMGQYLGDGKYIEGPDIEARSLYFTEPSSMPIHHTMASSTTDGAANTQEIVTYSTFSEDYEAADFCHNLEAHGADNWYLPAEDEWFLITQAYGDDEIEIQWDASVERRFWTSTTFDGYGDQAVSHDFPNGGSNPISQFEERNVRCIYRVGDD